MANEKAELIADSLENQFQLNPGPTITEVDFTEEFYKSLYIESLHYTRQSQRVNQNVTRKIGSV
jgi:hypothetical protein